METQPPVVVTTANRVGMTVMAHEWAQHSIE